MNFLKVDTNREKAACGQMVFLLTFITLYFDFLIAKRVSLKADFCKVEAS